MLKPIKTVRLKTAGLGIRFARRITERAAAVGGYELSGSELVFAMGAARERDDLLSVLELLDDVLDLIRRGFDRHANALAVRIINNVGIMLSRGGFSREYFNTVEICGKISAAVYGNTENFNVSECREEINDQVTLLRAEREKQTSGSVQKNAPRSAGARTLRLFRTVSERAALTVNTLNSGLLRIMTRNPELLKMIKSDKIFMQLSLTNIENVRRRAERAMTVQRFFDALTGEQIGLLERFIVNENLFSEIREKSSGDHDLKYLLENSSEKSLSEFFGALRQRTEERSGLLSERRYFDSAEEMKEFFVGAQRSEIERLIRELEKDRLYRSEARTLTDTLRLYDVEREKRRLADEKLAELYRIAEITLKHKIGEKNFSVERFIGALGTSNELKKIFADYAWENYRSDETVKRYSEYIKNTSSDPRDKLSDPEQAVFHTENCVISESAAPTAGAKKESFADFLINSGELSLKFSESVKNSFLNLSADAAAAFAEYLVNAVREDSAAHYDEKIRSVAERAENILYYEDSGFEEKSRETFSLISDAWNESALQLSELYAGFTQSRVGSGEILKLYSYIPKTGFKAVSEFLEAAAQGDAYFISLSKDFLNQSHNVLNKIGESFDITEENAGYTFYDALRDMPGDTLSLLLPLAGISGGASSEIGAAPDKNSSREELAAAEFAKYADSDGRTAESSGNALIVDQTSAFMISAAFAEYLSSTVRGDVSDHYNERTRTLAEKVNEVLRGEQSDIRGKSAKAFELIYNEWNNDPAQLSELYESFTMRFSDREESLRLYSRIPQNDLAELSDILNSAANSETNFFSLNSDFSKQPEKLFEQMSSLINIKNGYFRNEKDLSGAQSEAIENSSELILAGNDIRSEVTDGNENAKYGAFSERISDTVNELRAEKELYQRLATRELRTIIENLTSISSRSERRVYNIAQTENRLLNKSIVTDKAFYNALTAFSGDVSENISNSYFSEDIYPELAASSPQRVYFFTWENGSVTLFNRAAADKTRIRTNGFFEKRSASVLTLSERISEKFSSESQHSDYNTTVELFYTDEYFDSSGGIGGTGAAVNYAVPAPAASGSSDEVSEKLGNIRGAIESINTEISEIKRHEEEISREFVTKSEQRVFERELKSSIERDIYLAGKRHGIY